ncbi:MAG: hypothetical protein K6E30_02355 [Lachnospiraceae bacterium]|nr:hypothetical protein [Lachnospiraceae bacterium]
MSNDFISFEGSSKELDGFLGEYFPADQIKLVRKTMPSLVTALNKDETIKKVQKKDDAGGLGLIIFDDYFINVRKTTLALFALVMDIAYTKGFATFIFAAFGITAEKIRKLDYDEKQILLLINAEKILIDTEKDEYEINDERDYGYSSEEIKSIIDKLEEDDVVIRKGRELRVAF